MPLRLVVEESACDNSVVGLSATLREELALGLGDHVLVRGSGGAGSGRQSIGVCAAADNLDDRKIRMTKVMCKNVGARAGSQVTVCRLDGVIRGECISVLPFADTLEGVSIEDLNLAEAFLESYFKEQGLERPVVRGDVFEVPAGGASHSLEFKVVDVSPGESCVVGGDTAVKWSREMLSSRRWKAPLRQSFSPMVVVTVRDLKGDMLLPAETSCVSPTSCG